MYASILSVSTISLIPMLLSVFTTDAVSFTCVTGDGTQLNNTCPDNRVAECTSIVYDKSLWVNNLVMELDLICDRTWMKALPNYGWFTGMFFNIFILQMSDICGRWTIIFGFQMGLTITVFLSAAPTSIVAFRQVNIRLIMNTVSILLGKLTGIPLFMYHSKTKSNTILLKLN